MTEGLIVFATFIAGLLLADPFFAGGLTKATFAKGVVYALGFGSLGFHCLARAAISPERFSAALREVWVAWWPLVLLSVFVITGSVYARAVDDIKESFLNVGLGMLFLPLFALSVRSSDQPLVLMKWLAAMFILMALTALPILVSGIRIYHELMFLFAPIGTYLVLAPRFSLWRVVVGLALIGVCLLSFKNTTFLLVLLSLIVCLGVWLVRISKNGDRLAVLVGALVMVPAALVGLVFAAFAWVRHRDSLPPGNVEYRLEMYEIAWRKFLESPLWGNAFTDSSVVFFELYRVLQDTQYLPTHSDPLDLLANGGVVAAVLWLLVVKRQFAIAWFAARELAVRPSGVDLVRHRWLAMLGIMQVGAVVTSSFNPILISPVYAFWIWGSAGVMWALYQDIVAPPLPVKLNRFSLMQRAVQK